MPSKQPNPSKKEKQKKPCKPCKPCPKRCPKLRKYHPIVFHKVISQCDPKKYEADVKRAQEQYKQLNEQLAQKEIKIKDQLTKQQEQQMAKLAQGFDAEKQKIQAEADERVRQAQDREKAIADKLTAAQEALEAARTEAREALSNQRVGTVLRNKQQTQNLIRTQVAQVQETCKEEKANLRATLNKAVEQAAEQATEQATREKQAQQAETAEARKEAEELRQQLDDCNKKSLACTQNISALKFQHTYIKRQYTACKEKREELNDKITELGQNVQTFKDEQIEATEHTESIQDQLNENTQKLEECNKKKSELEQKLQAAADEAQTAQNAQNATAAANAANADSIQRLQTELNEAQKRNDALAKQQNQSKEELEQLQAAQAQAKQALQTAQENATRVQEQMAVVQQQIKEFGVAADASTEEATQKQQQVIEQTARIQELEAEKQKCEKAKQQALDQSNTANETKIDDLTKQLQEAQRLRETTQQATIQQRTQQEASAQAAVWAAEAAYRSAETELKAKLESANVTVAARVQEIGTLRQQLEAVESEAQACKEAQETASASINELEAQLANQKTTFDQEKDELIQQHAAKIRRLEGIGVERQQLENELAAANRAKDEAEENIEAATTQSAELQEQAYRLQQEQRELKAANKTLQVNYDTERKQSTECKDKQAELQRQLQTCSTQKISDKQKFIVEVAKALGWKGTTMNGNELQTLIATITKDAREANEARAAREEAEAEAKAARAEAITAQAAVADAEAAQAAAAEAEAKAETAKAEAERQIELAKQQQTQTIKTPVTQNQELKHQLEACTKEKDVGKAKFTRAFKKWSVAAQAINEVVENHNPGILKEIIEKIKTNIRNSPQNRQNEIDLKTFQNVLGLWQRNRELKALIDENKKATQALKLLKENAPEGSTYLMYTQSLMKQSQQLRDLQDTPMSCAIAYPRVNGYPVRLELLRGIPMRTGQQVYVENSGQFAYVSTDSGVDSISLVKWEKDTQSLVLNEKVTQFTFGDYIHKTQNLYRVTATVTAADPEKLKLYTISGSLQENLDTKETITAIEYVDFTSRSGKFFLVGTETGRLWMYNLNTQDWFDIFKPNSAQFQTSLFGFGATTVTSRPALEGPIHRITTDRIAQCVLIWHSDNKISQFELKNDMPVLPEMKKKTFQEVKAFICSSTSDIVHAGESITCMAETSNDGMFFVTSTNRLVRVKLVRKRIQFEKDYIVELEITEILQNVPAGIVAVAVGSRHINASTADGHIFTARRIDERNKPPKWRPFVEDSIVTFAATDNKVTGIHVVSDQNWLLVQTDKKLGLVNTNVYIPAVTQGLYEFQKWMVKAAEATRTYVEQRINLLRQLQSVRKLRVQDLDEQKTTERAQEFMKFLKDKLDEDFPLKPPFNDLVEQVAKSLANTEAIVHTTTN